MNAKPNEIWLEVNFVGRLFSLISASATIILLMTYLRYPALNRMPGLFIRRANSCEVVSSVLFVMLFYRSDPLAELHVSPMLLSACIVMFEVAASSWRMLMYVHLFLVYCNPFDPDRYRFAFWVAVVMLTCMSVTACSGFFVMDTERHIWRYGSDYFGTMMFCLFAYPLLIFGVLGGTFCLVIWSMGQIARHQATRLGHCVAIAELPKQRVMRHSRKYLLLHTLLLLGFVLICIYLWASNWPRAPFLWRVLAVGACGRPALTLLGWLVINFTSEEESCASANLLSRLRRVPDASSLHGLREEGFKEELRLDLLQDVMCSIGKIARQVFQPPGEPPRPADADAGAGAHPRGNPLLDSGDRSPESQECQRPGHAEHHGAESFHRIREAFGIPAESYAQSFLSDLGAESEVRQRLKESVSEGASGSFFYRVLPRSGQGSEKRYIIKQVSNEERLVLLRRLPAYMDHVRSRHGRSLIQYFGCHSVSLRWACSGKVHFVVMRDFLPVRTWLTFDLKGAVMNRRALQENLLYGQQARQDPRARSAWGTLRDWEWMDTAMICDISDTDKEKLAEMITADVAFLGQQGLIDYSLLVGIHRLESTESGESRQQKLTDLVASGGYASLDKQRVYFFGIIDVLESYTIGWKVQRCALTTALRCVCQSVGVDGISAMSPPEYASRFVTFVLSKVLQWPTLPQDVVSAGAPRELRCADCARSAPVDSASAAEERWHALWGGPRRGLVQERMEKEAEDFRQRITDLEHERREHLERIVDLESQLPASSHR
mmetsp:Transcript_134115/g.388229  ORF Transcript_134115/g.388229 Transcript_134115/m.388229 type:complete len:776 (-) Transcript_134115:117-2444(-)